MIRSQKILPCPQINIDERTKTIYDPLHFWDDHEACWRMQYRGSLGTYQTAGGYCTVYVHCTGVR